MNVSPKRHMEHHLSEQHFTKDDKIVDDIDDDNIGYIIIEELERSQGRPYNSCADGRSTFVGYGLHRNQYQLYPYALANHSREELAYFLKHIKLLLLATHPPLPSRGF